MSMIDVIEDAKARKECRHKKKYNMPKETDTQKLRLEQFTTLNLIEQSCATLRAKLLNSGNPLGFCSGELSDMAAILAEEAIKP